MLHDSTLNIFLGQAETCLSVIKPRPPASLCASPSAGQPMTHLAQTSSGSIHSVNSGGRPSSRGVSSLSSHAFRTMSQTVSLFIRIHLWIKRHYRSQLQLITVTPRWGGHFPDPYLYACPLLGLSGYQWFSYLSHRCFSSFSANSSALVSSSFPHATAIRFRKLTPALTSCFMVSAESNKKIKNSLQDSVICCNQIPNCYTFFFIFTELHRGVKSSTCSTSSSV